MSIVSRVVMSLSGCKCTSQDDNSIICECASDGMRVCVPKFVVSELFVGLCLRM